jgi:hypothetical protein
VSLVLVHPQRVEPKPPINSLPIYRNLLPTFDLCRLGGELDKLVDTLRRPDGRIVRFCREA